MLEWQPLTQLLGLSIEKTARQLLGPNCGAKIIISVPGGEETAKLTYNSRLGIVGGNSHFGDDQELSIPCQRRVGRRPLRLN